MKITKSQLEQIIKEEMESVVAERGIMGWAKRDAEGGADGGTQGPVREKIELAHSWVEEGSPGNAMVEATEAVQLMLGERDRAEQSEASVEVGRAVLQLVRSLVEIHSMAQKEQ